MSKTERKMCVCGRWAQRKDKTQPKQKKREEFLQKRFINRITREIILVRRKKKNKVTANKIHRITFLNKQ